jgi:hypothetical protein
MAQNALPLDPQKKRSGKVEDAVTTREPGNLP